MICAYRSRQARLGPALSLPLPPGWRWWPSHSRKTGPQGQVSTHPFPSLSFPHATHQASWRSGQLPTMVIPVLLFFLPGDQDLPQVRPCRVPPVHSPPFPLQAAPWGGVSHSHSPSAEGRAAMRAGGRELSPRGTVEGPTIAFFGPLLVA